MSTGVLSLAESTAIATVSNGPVVVLMGYEFQALLSVLRRDLRHERAVSGCCGDEEEDYWHESNARMDIRLLEMLQPKRVVAAIVAPPAEPVRVGLTLVKTEKGGKE